MALRLREARGYADRALDAARRMAVDAAVCVVDEFGQLVQLDRMETAPPLAADLARAKALTALNLRRPTREVAADFAANPETLAAMQGVARFTILPVSGGVPIMDAGRTIGAIGVSGGTGDQDDAVARAAVATAARA
jgi:glc operon protein GlcG